MLRAAALVFINEFRLLARDRVGMFMLILAPMVIIAVAGFSLGNIYDFRASKQAYVVPVVDQDRGSVAQALILGLTSDSSIKVLPAADLDEALHIVAERDRAPMAIVIPSGTTNALEEGRTGELQLYVDPVKRVEVNLLQLHLNELCREIMTRAHTRARHEAVTRAAEVRARLDLLAAQMKQAQAVMEQYRRKFLREKEVATAAVRARIVEAIGLVERQMQAQLDHFEVQRKAILSDIESRRDALQAVSRYVDALQTSQYQFELWFAALRAAAGSHSADIPSPPAFPAPPSREQLAELSRPIEFPPFEVALPALPKISLTLPDPPPILAFKLPTEGDSLAPGLGLVIPGELAWHERSLSGGSVQANAFDQYVPGFGITFLFIGMLMAIGLGLIDERDWGTLQRLQVSGAPLKSIIIGKLLARSLVGMGQMIVLFAAGWWIFDISLGRAPLMLLLPTAAISFAAATISLLTACLARTHDSVMPVGATIAMAMSAIGGCWWPLDFEPDWMRTFAQWLPTTWTMRAYNDLMIRHLDPSTALFPAAVTAGLGLLYFAVGMAAASKLYK